MSTPFRKSARISRMGLVLFTCMCSTTGGKKHAAASAARVFPQGAQLKMTACPQWRSGLIGTRPWAHWATPSHPRNRDSLYTDPGCKCPCLWVGVFLPRYPSVIWRTNPVPVTAVFPEGTAVHSFACMHAVPIPAPRADTVFCSGV